MLTFNCINKSIENIWMRHDKIAFPSGNTGSKIIWILGRNYSLKNEIL